MNRKQARSRWAEILGHDAEITGHVGPKYAGRRGKTWSLRCAAVSTIRRVVHEGQTPRPLQEKATK